MSNQLLVIRLDTEILCKYQRRIFAVGTTTDGRCALWKPFEFATSKCPLRYIASRAVSLPLQPHSITSEKRPDAILLTSKIWKTGTVRVPQNHITHGVIRDVLIPHPTSHISHLSQHSQHSQRWERWARPQNSQRRESGDVFNPLL